MDPGGCLNFLQRVTFRCGSESKSPTATWFFIILSLSCILVKSSTNVNFKGIKPSQLISLFYTQRVLSFVLEKLEIGCTEVNFTFLAIDGQ
jgi:hypothetical protein